MPNIKTILSLIFSSTILFFSLFVYAKPMLSPTKEEAYQSQLIVIAEYIGYISDNQISYFHGPIAQYRIIQVLKGVSRSMDLSVRYDFHDGSACVEEEGWKFSEELMPDIGSKWILFLGEDASNYWTTYRGDFGRWIANPENLKQVEEGLEEN